MPTSARKLLTEDVLTFKQTAGLAGERARSCMTKNMRSRAGCSCRVMPSWSLRVVWHGSALEAAGALKVLPDIACGLHKGCQT